MPNSNIIYPIWIAKMHINAQILDKNAAVPYLLINAKTMWPALILAANRKDRVIGRTVILIVSINTKKGFSQSGAPPGKRLAAQLEGLYTTAEMIKDIHKGNPNLNVKIKWLVNLNTDGSRPIKLIIIIITKSLTRIWFIPLMWMVLVRFDCSFIIIIIEYSIVEEGDGDVHKTPVKMIIGHRVKVQNNKGEMFRWMLLIPGSKDEKMSSIIKTWNRSIGCFEGIEFI